MFFAGWVIFERPEKRKKKETLTQLSMSKKNTGRESGALLSLSAISSRERSGRERCRRRGRAGMEERAKGQSYEEQQKITRCCEAKKWQRREGLYSS